jgi:hypothetical protein
VLLTEQYRYVVATNFPTSLDSNVGKGTTGVALNAGGLGGESHLGSHQDINDSVVALETKLGINSSADTSSVDYKLAHAPYANLTGVPSTFNPSAHASTHNSGGSDVLATAAAGVIGLIPSTDVQLFTTPGAITWTKPTVGTPQSVEIICIGGGGGGGAGGYAAAATAVGGGGGGSGGGYSRVTVPASSLGATAAGHVGAGGTGGIAQTTSGRPGANGQTYASATHDTWLGTAPNYFCYAGGGKPGGGGPVSAAGGSAGSISTAAEFVGVVGGAGSADSSRYRDRSNQS